MKHRLRFFRKSTAPFCLSTLLSAALLLTVGGALFAGDAYLLPGQPDGIALLPPPPAAGSEEEAADLAAVRAVFKGRSAAEEARAFRHASLAFSIFAPAIGPEFRLHKLPKTRALLHEVKKEIGRPIDVPKDYWKRRRPFQMDPRLSLGYREPSFSYPSGHSTRGTVYSLVLAELFPAHKEAILQTGRDIGWDRVLIAKHFITDVFAGRVLGKAIFQDLMESPAFKRDLAAAKEEIQAAEQHSLPAQALSP